MKIVIPVAENNGKISKLSIHFGRAPYFAIYSSSSDELSFVRNRSGHFGGEGTPAERIIDIKPNIVFALGMGPNAIKLFSDKGIKVKTGDFKTVADVIKNLQNLGKLEQECEDHKH